MGTDDEQQIVHVMSSLTVAERDEANRAASVLGLSRSAYLGHLIAQAAPRQDRDRIVASRRGQGRPPLEQ